jgi:hypothetical protein
MTSLIRRRNDLSVGVSQMRSIGELDTDRINLFELILFLL